ncbi:hypothetical protein PX52LOC_05807 [Limnoglobus roseus]|uniref:Uncharacterized protein n=2 Tax=Limnoglobus roseus TaxID=2598579 RepID=A0A5C1AH73_9BACT|nr:hypothetical protein PX52LOC_05807 [Limnoglobus roseus]
MSIEANVLKWALTGHTGASSKCMAAHLTGNECDGSYPHDAGDFGRCAGLLDAAPELRPLLPKMAEVNRYWAALVPLWDSIEALSGDYRKQTDAISKAIRPIEDKDSGVVRLGKGATIRFGAIKP